MIFLNNIFRTKKIKAFTLAEVLITLGIIGIVAQMTIPTLVNNFQEKSTVVSVKSAYSIISQAYSMAITENGPPNTWSTNADGSAAAASDFFNKISPFLKIVKVCNGTSGCLPLYKDLAGVSLTNQLDSLTNDVKFQLNNGYIVRLYINKVDCSFSVSTTSEKLQKMCGSFLIDTNGLKASNTKGDDFFAFYLTMEGIIPVGTKNETTFTFPSYCQKHGSAVTTGLYNGNACTAWVIYNENMDYKKTCGSTLSWNGPITCN